MPTSMKCVKEWMNTAEIVAVQVAGDGVFVEFADGLGTFFPGNFLQLHRQSNPNQLFVPGGEPAAMRSAIFALPDQGTQASRSPHLLT